MAPDIAQALQTDRTIDITTTGRKSGTAQRIEIWFHNVESRVFITGLPGTRDWYANLLANPQFTFHLKESLRADLPATARPIVEPSAKRSVCKLLMPRLGRLDGIDTWVERSPLIEVLCA